VLAGDRLLLNRDTETEPFLIALDRRSGTVFWRTTHEIAPGAITNS
jgi:hypothetical protein